MFTALFYFDVRQPLGWWVEYHQNGQLQKRLWWRLIDADDAFKSMQEWALYHNMPKEP